MIFSPDSRRVITLAHSSNVVADFRMWSGVWNVWLPCIIFNLYGWICLGLMLGIPSALWVGGLDVIHQVILRGMLVMNRTTPRRYSCLLDQAAEMILLRKVGGGYIFIHRYLLEYFSRLSIENKM